MPEPSWGFAKLKKKKIRMKIFKLEDSYANVKAQIFKHKLHRSIAVGYCRWCCNKTRTKNFLATLPATRQVNTILWANQTKEGEVGGTCGTLDKVLN